MNALHIIRAPRLTTRTSGATVALLAALLLFAAAVAPVVAQTDASTVAELDAFWAEVSRTVAEGDFAAYSATYHPDGVLVSGDRTSPIADALTNWEPDFVETREGESQPQVDFRFTRRAHDATSAHEIGIFRFTSLVPGGKPSVQYVHFEALMVKRAGAWLMLMEYQKGPATTAEWEAAK